MPKCCGVKLHGKNQGKDCNYEGGFVSQKGEFFCRSHIGKALGDPDYYDKLRKGLNDEK